MIRELLNPEVQDFIKQHQSTDPAQLALRLSGKDSEFPARLVVDQIKARQRARLKLPMWYGIPELIFPPGLALEQASSQLTAEFKSRLCNGARIVDLTGGAGVDSYYFSLVFDSVLYVEKDPLLCQIAVHNFSTLGVKNIEILNQPAEEFLNRFDSSVSVAYLDPSRRKGGQKVRNLEDYHPNVLELLDVLRHKAEVVVVKTSPMLDIKAALNALGSVTAVYVVAVKNECKEVLYLLSNKTSLPVPINAVNLIDGSDRITFSFDYESESETENEYSLPLRYIYEPNSAILKAGAFRSVGQKFGLKKLHASTHIYTSEIRHLEFPGRVFELEHILPFKPKTIRSQIRIKKAHIATRNFPWDAAQLRGHLKMADGGNWYLFGVKMADERLVILQAQALFDRPE